MAAVSRPAAKVASTALLEQALAATTPGIGIETAFLPLDEPRAMNASLPHVLGLESPDVLRSRSSHAEAQS